MTHALSDRYFPTVQFEAKPMSANEFAASPNNTVTLYGVPIPDPARTRSAPINEAPKSLIHARPHGFAFCFSAMNRIALS
jgi:hypothetical protein